jgi:hypothetical protein
LMRLMVTLLPWPCLESTLPGEGGWLDWHPRWPHDPPPTQLYHQISYKLHLSPWKGGVTIFNIWNSPVSIGIGGKCFFFFFKASALWADAFYKSKNWFLGVLGPPYRGIGATIRIGREMLCLPYADFFYLL